MGTFLHFVQVFRFYGSQKLVYQLIFQRVGNNFGVRTPLKMRKKLYWKLSELYQPRFFRNFLLQLFFWRSKRKEKNCAKLKLKEILHAQKFKTNQRVLYNNRWHYNTFIQDRNVTDVLEFFRITFRTSPGNGLFEALVQFNTNSEEFSVKLDGISRINAYGHDGDCMSMIDRNLEKYCFCITK